MRIVRYTGRFRRDYKREKSGRRGKRLDAELLQAVTMLANDESLPRRYFDHALTGEWTDHRDCHIRPGVILIYRKPDDRSLDLVRVGSHSRPGLMTSG
jgi:mRNA interferase YafQ